MVVGDGSVVRAGLSALVDVLHQFAAPTGERGSVLLMTGGLIVLGFLFLAFLFRSTIVGDLAPVANGRSRAPRVMLPPTRGLSRTVPDVPARAFEAGRETGRAASPMMDRAFDQMRTKGVEARILQSNAHWKTIRLYDCASCAHGQNKVGCEFERGLFAGAFEALTGELAKVHEVACVARGDPHCTFDVRHAPLLEAI